MVGLLSRVRRTSGEGPRVRYVFGVQAARRVKFALPAIVTVTRSETTLRGGLGLGRFTGRDIRKKRIVSSRSFLPAAPR